MAHHDIWWIKGQQMQAGYWTLTLLAALVAIAKLAPPTRPWLAFLAGGAVLFGSQYVWALYLTLIKSRARAKKIASLIAGDDKHGIFADTKDQDPKRDWGFPLAITSTFHVAWVLVLLLLKLDDFESWTLLPVASWIALTWYGIKKRTNLKLTV
jgi:hypothetical protein